MGLPGAGGNLQRKNCFVGLPEFPWRHSGQFFKHFSKISAVMEACHKRYICDRFICFPQKTFCLFNPVMNEIIHRRLVKGILKRADTFFRTDVCILGDAGNRYVFLIMF